MRLVYMGTPEAAVLPLKFLTSLSKGENSFEVVAVVSAPAKPQGRGLKPKQPPLVKFAQDQKIKVLQPIRAKEQGFLDELKNLRPDVIVVCAYGQILSSELLKIPQRATVNIHPSLLPVYRGATPVQSALLDGLKQTGTTIHFTSEELDAGNIIAQKSVSIKRGETCDELLLRLMSESGPLLVKSLSQLSDESFKGYSQDNSRISFCKKIAKEDGQINWNSYGLTIINRYRAFNSWPGSFTFFQGKRVLLYDMLLVSKQSDVPCGTFSYDKNEKSLLIACNDSYVSVRRLKKEGGAIIEASSFWNGLKQRESLIFNAG